MSLGDWTSFHLPEDSLSANRRPLGVQRINHDPTVNGRPTLLSGTLTPDQLESLPGRILVGPIHFCLLDAPHPVIAERLRDRPSWRGCTEEFIGKQESFAAALRSQIHTVFDTDTHDITQTADAIAAWANILLTDYRPNARSAQ